MTPDERYARDQAARVLALAGDGEVRTWAEWAVLAACILASPRTREAAPDLYRPDLATALRAGARSADTQP